MTPGRRRVPWRTLIQAAFTVLVIVFITGYLLSIDWATLEGLTLNAGLFLIACATALVYRYWGAGVWLYLLETLGARRIRGHWVELCYVYAKAWIGRYLLGAGTWILGKIYFAAQHGIGKGKLAVSGVLEAALQLIATLVVGLALVLTDARLAVLGDGTLWLAAIVLAGGFLALIPAVFRFGIRLIYRLVLRRPVPEDDLPNGRSIVAGGLLYVAGTIITGVSYFFIALAVYPALDWGDMLYIVGASSIAAAISLLAVFAPGGIGVREGVQVLFFSAIMPTEVAVVLSVFMRLWSVAVDGMFFATAAAVRAISRRRRRGDNTGA